MPSLSIECRSLLPLINCNSNKNSEISPHPTIVDDIALYFYNFYKSLYDIVVCDVFFIIQTQVCIFLDALLYWDQLWLDKKIYTVERLIPTCYDVCIILVSVLSGCPYWVSCLEKSHRHVTHLIYSIKEQGGRRVGTMTVAKSQGRETCWVGGRKFIKGLQTGQERKTYQNQMRHALWLQMFW